jgi:hypothetical protein
MTSGDYIGCEKGVIVNEQRPNYYEFYDNQGNVIKRCVAGKAVDISSFPDLEKRLASNDLVLVEIDFDDLVEIGDQVLNEEADEEEGN